MEKRSFDIKATDETQTEAAKTLNITGTAIVFNTAAKVGDITEIIKPEALFAVDLNDILLLVNHDSEGIPLARTPQTMTLTVTETGLEMAAVLPETEQGKAAYEAIRRGDLSKMSFAFDVEKSEFDEVTQTRTITAISRIYEISIVNFAAYTQTTVQARSAEREEEPMLNPIESAVFTAEQTPSVTVDTIATPEYRSAFYKTLLGQKLTEAETRAFDVVKAEKRADSFNTLTNTAAVIPTQTLNEIIHPRNPVKGLIGEIRQFSVPSNIFIPIGTPTKAAEWHTEGTPVEREKANADSGVTFKAFELIKILSMSAATQKMSISAFESYITEELRQGVTDSIGAALITGDGEKKPLGLISGITWNETNSLTPAVITADSILQTVALLNPKFVGGAKFAMSTATLFKSVYPQKNDIDKGDYYFIQPIDGGARKLFGFDIVLDENIPLDTMLFGNFKYYGVNIPSGVAIEASRESGFTSGLIDYRALCIADGKPLVKEAFVKLSVAEV